MAPPRYPAARWAGDGGPQRDGRGWGPLPDTARGAKVEQIRLVGHTTEGQHLPAYPIGEHPHLTYLPTFAPVSRWVQHLDFDRRAGTLVGSKTTGVIGNEIAVQFEIAAYSDKTVADERGHLWVGDFTDEHYADLAAFVAWARGNLFVPHLKLVDAYGPSKDFTSFIFGLGDAHEMSKAQWLAAGGILTGHGAGPGQAHWDTGMLDLHRIVRESLGQTAPAAATPARETLERGDRGPDVKAWQELLIALGHPLPKFGADSDFGQETETATKAFEARMKLVQDGVVSVEQFRLARKLLTVPVAAPPVQPRVEDDDVRAAVVALVEVTRTAHGRAQALLDLVDE